MNTIEAINARHSVGNFKPDAVSRNVIESLLSAAVQAPNHHKIRPWRFFVIAGAARDRLGEAMAEGLRRRNPLIGEESLIRERAKPLRAPAIIAVAVDRPTEERIIEIENICAAAAACQNLLLAATDLGLASYWRTGDAARDPVVKEFLGLEASQPLIAFIYVGYPGAILESPPRPGFDDRTTWLD